MTSTGLAGPVVQAYQVWRFRPGPRMALVSLLVVVAIFALFWANYLTSPEPMSTLVRWLPPAAGFLVLAMGLLYFLLWVAQRLELTESAVLWYAPLRSGQIGLADLREIKPSPIAGNYVITTGSGRRVYLAARYRQAGLRSFVQRLQRAAPHVRFESRPYPGRPAKWAPRP